MKTVTIGTMTIPATILQGESSVAPILGISKWEQETQEAQIGLDEDDGLFVGYGGVESSFPYRQQDCYDRELRETAIQTVTLENEFLRATFVPSLGGRLWSLFDKVAKKELTFSNPVFRAGNLAIRNAWFSGGVEWNIGMIGHHPFTCSPLFTGILHREDGTPVLRMYELERIRCVTYQMDFYLPENSRFLLGRMRIVNPNTEVVPMYWWSNIAVPEQKKGRVVMSTNETFTNRGGKIGKTTVPISDGIDITYPVNNPHAIDFFWKISDKKRKFVCQLDENGYGLIQTSTARLKGRKLFVWGQGPGGDKWQRYLSGSGCAGRYAEIQAGLANTQYECLPMPPKTAWEWLEAYGAMTADGAKVQGDWEDAKTEVEQQLDKMLSAETLEEMLLDTKESIAMKPIETMIQQGSGWGALEEMRRKVQGEKPLSTVLDFGECGEAQEAWVSLLKNGYFPNYAPNCIPQSWMKQQKWTVLMEKAARGADLYNWYAQLQIGMTYLASKRFEDAEKRLSDSMQIQPSCWAMYGLAYLAQLNGDSKKAALFCLKAALLKPEDASIVKEAMRMLSDAKLYEQVLILKESVPETVAQVGRIKLYEAFAHLRCGNYKEAEQLLYKNGGISVADIREGENSVTELWFELEEAKANAEGRKFSRETAEPPAEFDFRMEAEKK